MQKESIDLMNVDYEDVLHLYRGWRKSESLLKDKDKELASLKQRIKQLQDSHSQFRNQIQALESVKELTINLQAELTNIQQENKQLVNENRELAQLNLQAEALLKEKEQQETDHTKLMKNVQIEFATLKGRYEETLKIQKELEKIATDEQAVRMSLEQRLRQGDQTIESLREENTLLKQKLETANHKLNQCDQELMHASEQLSSISREIIGVNNLKEQLSSAVAENGVLKGDISRLLRLLEYSSATRDFIDQWQLSDGMNFVGFDRDPSSVTRLTSGNSLDITSGLDLDHDFADETKYDITPSEFAQLKRIHGRDPFPMTNSYQEETEYWVPKDAAKLGVNFITAKFPHANPQVIMEFLRSMNKIWLRRERRKVKKVKEVLGSTIEDLKRQLSHLKPYQGVIQERQIRRLKSQVKQDRTKMLTGRPRGKLEETKSKKQMFDVTDIDYLQHNHDAHNRRLCKQLKNSELYQDAEVNKISAEKLLEASLLSLETMGRKKSKSELLRNVSRMSYGGGDADGPEYNSDPENDDDDDDNRRGSGLFRDDPDHDSNYPNVSYLRGALWLGRNMTLLSEELVEELESYRMKYLNELSDIGKDTDYKRSCHRYSVLATSSINHTLVLANKSKEGIRDLLEGVSTLEPGNTGKFQRFLSTLPIESALTSSGRVSVRKGTAARERSESRNSRRQSSNNNNQHNHEEMESPSNLSRKSPNRSIRFNSILDSPMHSIDLGKTPR